MMGTADSITGEVKNTKKLGIVIVLLTLALIPACLAEGEHPLPEEPEMPDGAEQPTEYRSFVHMYISAVSPWNDGTGVSVLLTPLGERIGLWRNGARFLASLTITEYEAITGESWPYHLRSSRSVAREIQIHCWFTDASEEIVDIGFAEQIWG